MFLSASLYGFVWAQVGPRSGAVSIPRCYAGDPGSIPGSGKKKLVKGKNTGQCFHKPQPHHTKV